MPWPCNSKAVEEFLEFMTFTTAGEAFPTCYVLLLTKLREINLQVHNVCISLFYQWERN